MNYAGVDFARGDNDYVAVVKTVSLDGRGEAFCLGGAQSAQGSASLIPSVGMPLITLASIETSGIDTDGRAVVYFIAHICYQLFLCLW